MHTSIILCLVLAGTACTSAILEDPATLDNTAVDVIIIGAGWAGMAAADSLARANVSFIVLESTNRTGGRSHAKMFGDPNVWRGVVERGSNWVSGVAPAGVKKGGAGGVAKGCKDLPWENPVYSLAKQANLSMARIPGSCDGNMSGYNVVYSSDGSPNGDPNGRIRSRANDMMDCLNSSWARKVADNVTVREGLRRCGWNPHTEEEFAIDWAMSGEDANGEPARIESLQDFDPDGSYQWWGPDDLLVIDQHPRGFARLVDFMVRDSVPPGDPRVLFQAVVTKISYDCNGVSVSTRDGRKFSARHEVFSTLPLGVLQRNHTTLFEPALPDDKVQFLSESGFVMGNLTHVVIQFPTVWWDNTIPKWISANKGCNKTAAGGLDGGGKNAPGLFSAWHNLNHKTFIPGSHSLLTFLGDPQSSLYEGMPDAAVQAAVVRQLQLQHPHANISEPSAFFISRHGYDPNSYGAYSASLAGYQDNTHWILTEPLKACHHVKVRFAGEAMCDDLNGYTHGGYQSGKETAARYLHKHDKGPKPVGICDW